MSTILCFYPFAVTKKSFPTTFFIARGSIHDEYGNIGANDLVLHLSSREQSAAMQSMTGDELPKAAAVVVLVLLAAGLTMFLWWLTLARVWARLQVRVF